MEAWYSTSIDIEEAISGIVDDDVHIFVADVVKSFDTVDRNILECVLSSFCLPGWFRNTIMLMYIFGLNLLPDLVILGLEMGEFPKGAL